MDNLGAALKRLRRLQPGGQVGIARRAFPDVSREKHEQLGAYISKIETAQETNPSLDTLEWIARGCDLSLGAFFTALESPSAQTSSRATELKKSLQSPDELPTVSAFDDPGSRSSVPSGTAFSANTRAVLWDLVSVLAQAIRDSDAAAADAGAVARDVRRIPAAPRPRGSGRARTRPKLR